MRKRSTQEGCGHHTWSYGSQALAENAVILHRLSLPNCEGIEWYPCGDHFHIGHPSLAAGGRCKSDEEHLAIRARRQHR
jgi:hypothetical protein